MKNGKLIGIFALVLLVFSVASVYACECNGDIKTTDEDGVTVDKNLYAMGESVYINAFNFDPNALCGYVVKKVNQPHKGVKTSGNVTMNSTGGLWAEFIWDTTGAEIGEYKVQLTCGECKKSDNFRLEENEVPEFGLVTGGIALLGAGAGYLFMRRKK